MSSLIPQTLALVLVSSFVLCQPTFVAASTSTKTSQNSQPQATARVIDTNLTKLQPVAAEPSSKGKAEKPAAASSEKTLKKNALRSKFEEQFKEDLPQVREENSKIGRKSSPAFG